MRKQISKCFNSRTLTLPAFDHTPRPYTGKSYEETLSIRKETMSTGLPFFYPNDPLMLVEGKNQYVYDHKGERYLDLIGGIICITAGHAHPRITKVLSDQINLINHTSCLYLNEHASEYAKRLTDKFPSKLSKVILCNSGSEANETAVLLARLHTKNQAIVALREAYHGVIGTPAELTSMTNCRIKTGVYRQTIERLHCPDTYNGIFRVGSQFSQEEAVHNYINEANLIIKDHIVDNIAAVIMEPIQGYGGINDLPVEWMKTVIKEVRQRGGVWISDEVQTGFGRTGSAFWGFEKTGLIPDIVTMAKGIGNGFPLSAVVTTPEIADCLSSSFYFNTYGGNPLACRVGSEVLKIIEDEHLQQNSKDMGEIFLRRWHKMMEKSDIIGDVRGKGLLVGMEIVKCKESRLPNPEKCLELVSHFREHGILAGKGGLYGNIIRLGPPMCITKADVDYACDVMDLFFEKNKI
jgi:alanine-glyoxylate transaminase/(R)-3-amino-2-methylpropionate-pyruvate transaminase